MRTLLLTSLAAAAAITGVAAAQPAKDPVQLEAIERVVEGNARPVQPRNDRPLVLG